MQLYTIKVKLKGVSDIRRRYVYKFESTVAITVFVFHLNVLLNWRILPVVGANVIIEEIHCHCDRGG